MYGLNKLFVYKVGVNGYQYMGPSLSLSHSLCRAPAPSLPPLYNHLLTPSLQELV